MAIDTAAKRKSMMGWGDAWDIGIVPSGAIDADARATLLDLYEGITLDIITVADPIYCVYYTPISDRNVVLSMTMEDDYEVMDTEIVEVFVLATPINDRVVVLSTTMEDDYEVLNTPVTC